MHNITDRRQYDAKGSAKNCPVKTKNVSLMTALVEGLCKINSKSFMAILATTGSQLSRDKNKLLNNSLHVDYVCQYLWQPNIGLHVPAVASKLTSADITVYVRPLTVFVALHM